MEANTGFAAMCTICLVVLTIFATVLFLQHEADRQATIDVSRPSPAPPTVTCPDGSIVPSVNGC